MRGMSNYRLFAQAYRRQVWRTVPHAITDPYAAAAAAAAVPEPADRVLPQAA